MLVLPPAPPQPDVHVAVGVRQDPDSVGAQCCRAGEGAAVFRSRHDVGIRRRQCEHPLPKTPDLACSRRDGEIRSRASVVLERAPAGDAAEALEQIGRIDHASSIRQSDALFGALTAFVDRCRQGRDCAETVPGRSQVGITRAGRIVVSRPARVISTCEPSSTQAKRSFSADEQLNPRACSLG